MTIRKAFGGMVVVLMMLVGVGLLAGVALDVFKGEIFFMKTARGDVVFSWNPEPVQFVFCAGMWLLLSYAILSCIPSFIRRVFRQ
jgi:hypothetical protein